MSVAYFYMFFINHLFSDITKCWSGENYVSSSLVYPILFNLHKKMKQRAVKRNKSSRLVQTFRVALKLEIQKRFKVDRPEILLQKSFMFASALDPRFKDLKFLSENDTERIRLANCVWGFLRFLTEAKVEELKKKGKVQLSDSLSTAATAGSTPPTSSSKDKTKNINKSPIVSLLGTCYTAEEDVEETNGVEYEKTVAQEVGRTYCFLSNYELIY